MYGLYILKLVPKEGVFVTGGQYTVLGAEFVKQLVLCKKRIAPHMYELDKKDSYKEVADQIAMINVPVPGFSQKADQDENHCRCHHRGSGNFVEIQFPKPVVVQMLQ